MAKIVRSVTNADNVPIIVHLLVDDNQTIDAGDILQIESTTGKLEVAVAASTSLVGIAMESITTTTATAADVIPVALIKNQVVRLDVYQGGAKDTFAQADFYLTAYDLENKTSVDANDTTNGMCYVVANDQTANTADVIFADASLAHVG